MLTVSISHTGNKIYCTKVAGSPGQTAVLKKYFMEVWEQSQTDEEMRRLHL